MNEQRTQQEGSTSFQRQPCVQLGNAACFLDARGSLCLCVVSQGGEARTSTRCVDWWKQCVEEKQWRQAMRASEAY